MIVPNTQTIQAARSPCRSIGAPSTPWGFLFSCCSFSGYRSALRCCASDSINQASREPFRACRKTNLHRWRLSGLEPNHHYGRHRHVSPFVRSADANTPGSRSRGRRVSAWFSCSLPLPIWGSTERKTGLRRRRLKTVTDGRISRGFRRIPQSEPVAKGPVAPVHCQWPLQKSAEPPPRSYARRGRGRGDHFRQPAFADR
jgi:hypothetical protein